MICCGVPRTLPSGPDESKTRLMILPRVRGRFALERERDLEERILSLIQKERICPLPAPHSARHPIFGRKRAFRLHARVGGYRPSVTMAPINTSPAVVTSGNASPVPKGSADFGPVPANWPPLWRDCRQLPRRGPSPRGRGRPVGADRHVGQSLRAEQVGHRRTLRRPDLDHQPPARRQMRPRAFGDRAIGRPARRRPASAPDAVPSRGRPVPVPPFRPPRYRAGSTRSGRSRSRAPRRTSPTAGTPHGRARQGRGIAPRHLQRRGRDIDPDPGRQRSLGQQAEKDRPGAGAQIQHPREGGFQRRRPEPRSRGAGPVHRA